VTLRRQGRRRTTIWALLAALALVLAACGGSAESSDGASAGASGGGEAAEGGEGGEGPFTIGLSNGFVGSEWRTQMVEDVRDVFAEYEEQGLVDELIVESADVDVNGQIQQIRNLISAGVDAIIVNPNSATALNAVFQEAEGQGIQVYATDQAVEAESVTNVVIDQTEWGASNAEWLAGEVGDGGRIVAINGIAGHPANEARWTGAQQVFSDANIEVLANANADWDEATAQQQMSDLLATYQNIDGVFTQDGMALGVYRALEANDQVGDITQTGEARAGFMQAWNEQLESDTDFGSIGVVNPPGIAGTALRVAVNELQGNQVAEDAYAEDGHTLFAPIPGEVTNDTFEEYWPDVEDQPEAYVVDSIMTEDEVQQEFFSAASADAS
jgi:ribose transport system substrate-binding protein